MVQALSSSTKKRGFTLIEMLISVAIFSVIIVAFIGILVVVTQIQVQSSSAAAVNQESQFLLQKVQYYIETASLINIATSTPTSTLQFYVASSSADPSYITLSSTGTVYLQQTLSGPLMALTSPKVKVTNLSFTRNANPPGHDAVSVSFTMAYNSANAIQSFSQLFQSSIEHVSAATFDTSVLPSSGVEPLGSGTNLWSPINNVIYSNAGNVGIGTSAGAQSPVEQLSIGGAMQLLNNGSPSSCSSGIRGTLWFYSPGGAAQDHLYLCAATATGTVAWETIY